MLPSWLHYFGSIIVPIGSLAVAVFAAIAAARSAQTANQARDDLAMADRERCLREVSLLANKIDAAAIDVCELYQELKINGDAMFSMAGRVNGGRHELFKSEIKEKREAVESIQEATRCLLKDNLTTLSDDQITERLLKLDGHLVHAERIRRTFDAELAFVKAEISFHLQLTELRRLSTSAAEATTEAKRANFLARTKPR